MDVDNGIVYKQLTSPVGNNWSRFADSLEDSVDPVLDGFRNAPQVDTYQFTNVHGGAEGGGRMAYRNFASLGPAGGRLALRTEASNPLLDTADSTSILYQPFVSNDILLAISGTTIADAMLFRVCQIRTDQQVSININHMDTLDSEGDAITADTTYDVFAYWDSVNNRVALELTRWSTATTRLTGVARHSLLGWYRAGAATRRLLGTIRTYLSSGSIVAYDTPSIRAVCNVYNTVPRPLRRLIALDNHTYNLTTIRAYANSATVSRVSAVMSVVGHNVVELHGYAKIENSGSSTGSIGIGVDTTTEYDAHCRAAASRSHSVMHTHLLYYEDTGPVGFHEFQLNQSSLSGTSAFVSRIVTPITAQYAGLIGTIMA